MEQTLRTYTGHSITLKDYGLQHQHKYIAKSPNSAHSESAFAGVLGVRLGGGAYYGGKFEAREYLNPEGRDAVPYDIVRAWRLLDVSCSVFAFLVILLSWIT